MRTGLKATAETWLLTVDGAKGTWEQLDVAGPAARVAATLDALPDGRVLLSGGWDPATGGTSSDACAPKRSASSGDLEVRDRRLVGDEVGRR